MNQRASTNTSEDHAPVAGWHVVPGTQERSLVHDDGRTITFMDEVPEKDDWTPGERYLRAKWGDV